MSRLDPDTFAALADPNRQAILELLAEADGRTAGDIAEGVGISRQGVLKHLRVLTDTGLVGSRRSGREVRFTVRPERLRATARDLDAVAAQWDRALLALKRAAESARD